MSHSKNTSRGYIFQDTNSSPPTQFGMRRVFFSFSSKIPYAHFLNGLPRKNKKMHQMCYCDVRTLQTKSTMYKQCKQNSRDFAKKVLVIKLDPPKIARNRRAWSYEFNNSKLGKTVIFKFYFGIYILHSNRFLKHEKRKLSENLSNFFYLRTVPLKYAC